MMDWVEKREKARAKIAEKGGAIILRRATKTYDKRTDKTTTTSEEVPCHAVFSEEEVQDDQGRALRYSVATLTEPALSGDTIVAPHGTFAVSQTLVIAPAGVPIMWTAILQT